MKDIYSPTLTLDEQITVETDASRRYWLKQARMHLRAAKTHTHKGNEILRKLRTYPTGQPVNTGV